jgi:hypothetical protein
MHVRHYLSAIRLTGGGKGVAVHILILAERSQQLSNFQEGQLASSFENHPRHMCRLHFQESVLQKYIYPKGVKKGCL